MEIRSNIFISIFLHSMFIAAAFIIGGSSNIQRENFMLVSLFEELPHIERISENKEKINGSGLAMTDEWSFKNSQTENTTLEGNKENNPFSPPFISPLVRGDTEG